MAKAGRPARKKGPKAQAKRAASRAAYQSLSVAERKALVQNRSKEAQREGDARRYASQKQERDTYHRQQGRARSKAPPRPKDCQWPGCSRSDIQFHHQGIDKWLCPTHHAQARKRLNESRGGGTR